MEITENYYWLQFGGLVTVLVLVLVVCVFYSKLCVFYGKFMLFIVKTKCLNSSNMSDKLNFITNELTHILLNNTYMLQFLTSRRNGPSKNFLSNSHFPHCQSFKMKDGDV